MDIVTPDPEEVRNAFGEWVSELAVWEWFVTLTFRDLEKRTATKSAQAVRLPEPDSLVPLRSPRNTRQSPRMAEKSGTTWTKPGWAYAKRAWQEFLKASAPAIDRRKWIRVFEIQKHRGIVHIHALVSETAGSPRRMDMVGWGWNHYGITRVLAYDPRLGAAHYLGKYLTKEMFDLEFGGFDHVED